MPKMKKAKTEPTMKYIDELDPQLREDYLYWSNLMNMETWSVNSYFAGDKESERQSDIQYAYHIAELVLRPIDKTAMEEQLLIEVLRCAFPPIFPPEKGGTRNKLLKTLASAMIASRYCKGSKQQPTWEYSGANDPQFEADVMWYTDILSLKSWALTYRFSDDKLTLGSAIRTGENSIAAEKDGKISNIVLFNLENYCMELALVHELLHCQFPPIRENEKSYWLHWLVEIVARGILIARYKLPLEFRGIRMEDTSDG